MRKCGVKFNTALIRQLALRLIANNQSPHYGSNMIDLISQNPIALLVTPGWVQRFMQKEGIVSRSQCGRLMVSPEKQEQIEREVAYLIVIHLGCLKREFDSGALIEEDVFNADETLFCINMDNHKTLALIGDKHVRYTDVVSGDVGMTMMVLISGGPNASLCPPFMIFQNDSRSHPIRGVPDDVPGVSYRSGPKGWIDRIVFELWLREPRVIKKLQNDRKHVLYIDNCSGHALTAEVEKALQDINTEVRFFPANGTQPADSFIIQKIKTAWRSMWDEKKLSMIEEGLWTDGEKSCRIQANTSF